MDFLLRLHSGCEIKNIQDYFNLHFIFHYYSRSFYLWSREYEVFRSEYYSYKWKLCCLILLDRFFLSFLSFIFHSSFILFSNSFFVTSRNCGKSCEGHNYAVTWKMAKPWAHKSSLAFFSAINVQGISQTAEWHVNFSHWENDWHTKFIEILTQREANKIQISISFFLLKRQKFSSRFTKFRFKFSCFSFIVPLLEIMSKYL